MEIDDLDREIQRLHDTVLLKTVAARRDRSGWPSAGWCSRSDLEREAAAPLRGGARGRVDRLPRAQDLRARRHGPGHPRRRAEGVRPAARLDRSRRRSPRSTSTTAPSCSSRTRRSSSRKAISRQELEDAELHYNTAEASVALSRSREAQVLMELAARNGEKPYDPAEYHRLKIGLPQGPGPLLRDRRRRGRDAGWRSRATAHALA